MSDIWKQFGSDYDTVNQNLGGAADWLKGVASSSKIQPSQQTQPQAQPQQQPIPQANPQDSSGTDFLNAHPVLRGIYSSVYNAANTLTGGMWHSVGQQVNPQLSNEIESMTSKAPIAAGIGQGAALAGQVISAPTAGIEGLGPVAKNALTAGFISGPGAAAEGIGSGNWANAIKDWALNSAIGGIAGGTAEKIPDIFNTLKSKLQDLNIRGAGITPKALKMNLGKMPLEQIENAKRALSDLITDTGAYGKIAQQKIVDELSEPYKLARAAWDDSGQKIGDIKDNLLSDNGVLGVVKTYGEKGQNAINDLIDQMSGKPDAYNIRQHLDNVASSGFPNPNKSISTETRIESEAAQALKDAFDNHIGGMAGQNLMDANSKYGPAPILRQALKQHQLSPESLFAANSATAPRLAVLQNLAKGALVGAGGSSIEQMAQGGDVDPTSIAIATLLGGLGNTALNRTANVAVGRGAGQLARVMGSMSPETAQALGPMTSKLTASLLSNQGQAQTPSQQSLPQDTSGIPQMPPIAAQMPQGPQQAIAPGSPLSRMASGGQIFPQPPQSPLDENTMAAGRAINDKEQELTTQQVKDAQQTTLSAFDDSIRKKVFRDWSTWQNPFKGDFDSFYAEVYNETNGFDPKNANTARVIAGSDFANYQKTYQTALEMQSLGKDLTRAISYNPVAGPVSQYLDPEGHDAHEKLVNTLWTAMTGESKAPQGKDRANIESRLMDLRRERLDEGGAKSKLFEMMQKEYGLNFDLLHQYGLLS